MHAGPARWLPIAAGVLFQYFLVMTQVLSHITLRLVLLAVVAMTAAGPVMAAEADNSAAEAAPDVRTSYTLDNCLQVVPVATALALDLTGVKARHAFWDRTAMMGLSTLLTVGVSKGLKWAVSERRPDHTDMDAFPSGHAAIAFMGAEVLYQEYRDLSPWLWIGGYTVATATAVLRVHHKRHYVHDVLAGAAIGVGCTKLVYWLYPKIVGSAGRSGRAMSFVAAPWVAQRSAGCSAMVTF